jgi:hypothetical protein
MCHLTEDQHETIRREYAQICDACGLKPLPLDAYVYVSGSNSKTELRTKLGNATPLYGETLIVLPIVDASEVPDAPLPFPPDAWNPFSSAVWPAWRTELWHECVHQVEDKILHVWRAGEDNPKTFLQAAEEVARNFGVSAKTIIAVT